LKSLKRTIGLGGTIGATEICGWSIMNAGAIELPTIKLVHSKQTSRRASRFPPFTRPSLPNYHWSPKTLPPCRITTSATNLHSTSTSLSSSTLHSPQPSPLEAPAPQYQHTRPPPPRHPPTPPRFLRHTASVLSFANPFKSTFKSTGYGRTCSTCLFPLSSPQTGTMECV